VSHHCDSLTILVISGSTRAASTNSAACRTAVQLAPPGLDVECYLDLASLPHFNPDDDHDPLPRTVAKLRATVAAADAVLFCTPEYAGTLPGALKNLLDWMVGGDEFTAKPVAWIKVAADPRRGEGAHATLTTVLSYVQATIFEKACRHVPITPEAVTPDGLIADSAAAAQIVQAVQTLADAVKLTQQTQ
jgi:chromate reductase, NAD(P)H dehydrogenase (quinone)